AAGGVAQEKRRRAGLAGFVAACHELVQVRRILGAPAEVFGPGIGDGLQPLIERAPQRLHRPRQRRGKISILPFAEAKARHVDRAPPGARLLPEGEERSPRVLVHERAEARPSVREKVALCGWPIPHLPALRSSKTRAAARVATVGSARRKL